MARTQGGTAVFLQNRDFFGAMVVHVPLFDALRRAAPDHPIVTYAPFDRGRIFQSLGLADDTFVYAHTGGTLWSDVREHKFDRVVLLRPQSFGLTALLSTAGAKRTLGYTTALSKLVFSHTIRRDTRIYRARNYTDLIASDVEIPPFPECVERLARRSTRQVESGAIVLMPCGSEARKLWGERNFVAIAQRLVERDRATRFTLVLGRDEARYVELFREADLGDRTNALIDGSLADIARTVSSARVVIANDCGPSHVAQLAGVPMVLLFGNWDGGARARIDEWFDPRRSARCLTTAGVAPIDSIEVADVVTALESALDESRGTIASDERIVEITPAAKKTS